MMKPDFRKVLRAFEEEPEAKLGELPPGDCFYPNHDWQQRFCIGCELARVLVVVGESGDEGREYVCNRLASGKTHCPHEKDHREGYRQSVPLTPGPRLDDVIDSLMIGGASSNGRYSTWIHTVGDIPLTCSACGENSPPDDYEYCPHCGTRMEMVVK